MTTDYTTMSNTELTQHRDEQQALAKLHKRGPLYADAIDAFSASDDEVERRGNSPAARRRARMDALDDTPVATPQPKPAPDLGGRKFWTDEFGREWIQHPGRSPRLVRRW